MNSRVLIVDDNHDLADGLAELLEIDGYDTDTAYNGAEAEEKLATVDYDYCLTDIKLPDSNGIEIYNRAKQKIPDNHIIAISGFRLEQIISSVFDTDNVSMLNIDFNPEALRRTNKEMQAGFVYLLQDNHQHDQLDDDFLLEGGIQNFHIIRDCVNTVDIASLPDRDVYVFDIGKSIICPLAIAYEVHKHNNQASFIIKIPSTEGIEGNPLQSYKLTGVLFKPFNTTELLGLLEAEDQLPLTSN